MNLLKSLLRSLFFAIALVPGLHGQCSIVDMTATPSDCDGGEFFVTIDFQYANVGNDGFRVQGNGHLYGNFSYDDLPIVIGPLPGNGTTNYEFVAKDNQFPDCQDFVVLGTVSCNTAACQINELQFWTSDCDAEGNYNLKIQFIAHNPTHTHFDVIYNGNVVGYFPLAALPVTITDFPSNGEEFPFVQVCINDNADCCAGGEFEAPNCNAAWCEIWDVVATHIECDGDQFFVTLDFEYENVGQNGFKVQGNGILHGIFQYADLPITIGPLPANGTFWEFGVKDVDHPDCHDFVEVGLVDCGSGDCLLSGFFAEAHPCNDDGLYLLDFEFESQNTGNQGFIVHANGLVYGPYSYNQVFYTIGPLHGGTVYNILIKDIQFPDCKLWVEWGPVFCDDGCHIHGLEAEASPCDSLGQFYVTLDFLFENTGDDGFKVVGNGNVYGFFEYGDLPVTLGPFESGSLEVLEFLVRDVAHPDCKDAVALHVPDCNGANDDCSIHDLVVDTTPCLGDGTFYVFLEFAHQNTGDIGFRVQGNGVQYGLYEYDDLPISIGPLVGNGLTPYSFTVSDLGNEDCAETSLLGTVDCQMNGDCDVSELIAVPGSCHSDGTYNLWINFDFENAPNTHFDVIYKGQIIDYFALASLPVVVPHFQSDGAPQQEIKICINDTPDCCATFTFTDPQCMSPNGVWPGDANANALANHFDLLQIGLAFNGTGPARSVQGIEWTELLATDWDKTFGDGLNFKHADCNGDGHVTMADKEAVAVNFGQTNGLVQQPVLLGGTADDPPFFVDLPGASDLASGSQFFAPIILGTVGKPVTNLYGVAFTLVFDPAVIAPGSIHLQYDPSWLGVAGVNLLSFDKTHADQGRIDVALVRTDQNQVSGFGQIMGFIGVIDNIAGKETIKVEIENVRAIRGNEALIPLYRPVEIAELPTATDEANGGSFLVFPNPIGTVVHIQSKQGWQVNRATVQSTKGSKVLEMEGDVRQLDTSNLMPGVYWLKLETQEGAFVERLVKL